MISVPRRSLRGRPSSASEAAPLRVENVTKHFAGVTALNGVSLQLNRGETLGLIGPNGSGKSTLVNCVSGVLEADEGEIELEGHSVRHGLRSHRARLGLGRTFQNLKLFNELTVRENVTVGCSARPGGRRSDESLVSALLSTFRLDQFARTVVSSLPYGYQRRVEMARALASRPRVLMLDEPAAGLNDGETEELRHLLGAMRSEFGCSLLVIDHDMNLVFGVSDRVLVLDEGHLIYEGPPSEVFQQAHVVEAYLGS